MMAHIGCGIKKNHVHSRETFLSTDRMCTKSKYSRIYDERENNADPERHKKGTIPITIYYRNDATQLYT